MRRTQPLVDIDSKQASTIEEFDKKWEADELEGWVDVIQKAQVDGNGEGIWCSACKHSVIRLHHVLPVFKAKRCTQNKPSTMPISHQKSTLKLPPGKLRQTNLLLTRMVLPLRIPPPGMQRHRRISIGLPLC